MSKFIPQSELVIQVQNYAKMQTNGAWGGVWSEIAGYTAEQVVQVIGLVYTYKGAMKRMKAEVKRLGKISNKLASKVCLHYLPTVKVLGNEAAIISGRLKLQSGQWLDCGCTEQNPTLSRFVALDGGVMIIAHGESSKEVAQNYRALRGLNQ